MLKHHNHDSTNIYCASIGLGINGIGVLVMYYDHVLA